MCSTANELQQNSNASSREDYIPQVLTVLLEILRVYIWPLWPFVFCLSFVNKSLHNVTTPSTNQRFWPDSGHILRHQYGISVVESQTFLRAKCPHWRRARRNGCFRRLQEMMWRNFKNFQIKIECSLFSFSVLKYATTSSHLSSKFRLEPALTFKSCLVVLVRSQRYVNGRVFHALFLDLISAAATLNLEMLCHTINFKAGK